MTWPASEPWLFLGAALLFGVGAVSLVHGAGGLEVEFESRESLTESGGPVYNRVRFERNGREDIWLMQQSHAGPSLPHASWDRLAIKVDRDAKTTRFYQLEPGPLALTKGARELPFKVACYLCHANGPRAIRPRLDSPTHRLGLRENVAVFLWNLRIAGYGTLRPAEGMSERKFAARSAHLNAPLRLRACASCHSGEPRGRAELRRQHFMPIRFLVENKLMPPKGVDLSAEDRRELDRFLSGLL